MRSFSSWIPEFLTKWAQTMPQKGKIGQAFFLAPGAAHFRRIRHHVLVLCFN
jgi:hypothetical protein